jgi:signal transduction histidine kinase/ActR/RegA family two-component response regulator
VTEKTRESRRIALPAAAAWVLLLALGAWAFAWRLEAEVSQALIRINGRVEGLTNLRRDASKTYLAVLESSLVPGRAEATAQGAAFARLGLEAKALLDREPDDAGLARLLLLMGDWCATGSACRSASGAEIIAQLSPRLEEVDRLIEAEHVRSQAELTTVNKRQRLYGVAQVFASVALCSGLALAALWLERLRLRSESQSAAHHELRKRTQALEELNAGMALRNRKEACQRLREQAKGRALAALTADAELDEAIGAALGELAGPVGAAVMVCYQIEGSELVPVAHNAASESVRTTRVRLTGLAERVLAKGNIGTVEQVPEGIDWRLGRPVAPGRPRHVVLVPLVVARQPTGLLMVGAGRPLDPEAGATLAELASPIALTMARRTLLDHTELIARELARRNEELKAQQEELQLKNLEVEKADRLKGEFLANVSHELRTPLNAVIGFSDLLLDEKSSFTPSQGEWIEDIQASGKHLLMLINRVLDLAKIDAGRMKMQLEPVSPFEAVASACTLVGPAAQKKRIAVSLVENPARPVQADRLRLQQVLLNLLANAVKFSPPEAPVEAGVEEVEGAVRFWVRDRGPGIDLETQRNLFQPFFQAESPLVKKHEGTGLGLVISRKLIEQQGGAMGVSSVPGEGSTFFFILPLATEEAAAAAPEPPPEARALLAGAAGRTALVVDDNPLNRDLTREMLRRRGWSVLLASDGEEAVAMALANTPELILLDLAMPGKDGFAVARELRADPRTRAVPLVALTAMAMRGDDERVLAAGFDGYLSKPLERTALDAVLARLFRAADEADVASHRGIKIA